MTTTRTFAGKVQIAFDKRAPGLWYLDTSGLDSSDGLYDGLPREFTGALDDVTDDVDSTVTVTLGTDTEGVVQATTCDFDLIRPSAVSQWNPLNAASDANAFDPGFMEMRPVRVTANNGGGDLGLFWGFIRNAKWDPETGLCSVHCEDMLYRLTREWPEIPSTGPTTTGGAIYAILAACNWVDPSLSSLAAGDPLTDFSADGSRQALDLIASLIEAERGMVYQDPTSGIIVYHDRHWPQLQTPITTLTDALSDLATEIDADRRYTRAAVTKTGGVTQTATLGALVEDDIGRNDLQPLESPYIPDDASAQLLAGDLLYESNLSGPVSALIENENAANATLQLQLRPGQAIDVVETLGGTNGEYTVGQIKSTLDVQGFYLATEILGFPRTSMAFAIDVSGLDGTSELRY